MSDTRTLFLYIVTSGCAKYVIAAHGEHDAASQINSRPETITIQKLGCVTADVNHSALADYVERTGVERGILCREWLPA